MGKFIGLLTGLVLIMLAFTGITVFIGGLEDTYNFGLTNTSNYSLVYTRLNDTSDLQEISDTFRNKAENIGNTTNPVLGYVDLLFYSGSQAVQTGARSIGIATAMVSDSLSVIPFVGTNEWISTGIIIMMVISIAGLILGIIMRRDL